MSKNDNHGNGTAHLFAPIQAQRIRSISRKAVQKCLAYGDAVNAQSGMLAVSYRSCFASMFLKSLVMARLCGAEISEVTQCTDDIIKAKLEEISDRTKFFSVEAAPADVK